MGLLSSQFKSRIAVMDQELYNYVEFDAMVTATYSGETRLTDHPVEQQLDMTDHIRRAPTSLTMRGIVSNYPIMALASFRAEPAVPGTDPASRAEEAFNFLEATRQLGSLVHVVTSLWDLEDMVITSLSCTRDKESGNIVDIQLGLREIQIATTQQVSAKASSTTPKNGGRKVKSEAPAPVAAKASSILFRLLGG